jgi:hypothetical protein
MSLLEQVEVWDKLDGGMSISEAGHYWSVMEPTIRFVKKNEDKARQSVKSNAPLSAKISCVSRRDGKGLACMAGRWATEIVEKAVPADACLKTVPDVGLKEYTFQGPPCHCAFRSMLVSPVRISELSSCPALHHITPAAIQPGSCHSIQELLHFPYLPQHLECQGEMI